MRVLCFHGFRTSGLILKDQMRTLGKSLDPSWDLVFVDAPTPMAKDAKMDDAVLLAFPRQVELGVYEWYNSNTVSGKVEYTHLPESIAHVKQLLLRSEPFDVLLGFSQGGTFAWMVSGMIESGEIALPAHKRPKLVVMLNSNGPRTDAYLTSPVTTTSTATLQAFGARDKLISPDSWQRWAEGFLPRVETEETHAVPRTAKSCEAVVQAISASTRRRWFAFDFDGVLCDSASETGKTALVCLKLLLPELQVDGDDELEWVRKFCTARPVLETGFEAIVIMHRLVVGRELAEDMVNSPTALHDMERALDAMPWSKQQLMDLFKRERDLWIERDEEGWLASNSFYSPALDALKQLWTENKCSVYVITTKHRTFARKLLERAGVVDFPEDRLFGLGSGKKRDVLGMLASTREARLGGHCVFVEDRVETLRDVAANGALPVHLVLAGYGYNTARDRASALESGFTVCETGQALKSLLLT